MVSPKSCLHPVHQGKARVGQKARANTNYPHAQPPKQTMTLHYITSPHKQTQNPFETVDIRDFISYNHHQLLALLRNTTIEALAKEKYLQT
jgi:hypothetical protein